MTSETTQINIMGARRKNRRQSMIAALNEISRQNENFFLTRHQGTDVQYVALADFDLLGLQEIQGKVERATHVGLHPVYHLPTLVLEVEGGVVINWVGAESEERDFSRLLKGEDTARPDASMWMCIRCMNRLAVGGKVLLPIDIEPTEFTLTPNSDRAAVRRLARIDPGAKERCAVCNCLIPSRLVEISFEADRTRVAVLPHERERVVKGDFEAFADAVVQLGAAMGAPFVDMAEAMLEAVSPKGRKKGSWVDRFFKWATK